MRVGVIGVGRVGTACALALMERGSAREIVLVDRNQKRAQAVATDMRYGGPLAPTDDRRSLTTQAESLGSGEVFSPRRRTCCMGKVRLDRSSSTGGPAQLELRCVASQELRTVANYIDEYRSMASAGELGTVLDVAIEAESPQERVPRARK